MANEIQITLTATFGVSQTPATQLVLREPFLIEAGNLDEALRILEKFHELAEELRDEFAKVRK